MGTERTGGLRRLLNRAPRLDAHSLELAAKGGGALLVKAFGALSALGFYALTARLLEKSESGAFFVSVNVVIVAATVVRFGLDNAVTRAAARAHSISSGAELKGLIRTSLAAVAVTACAGSVALALASGWLSRTIFESGPMREALLWGAVGIIPTALSSVLVQFLQGIRATRRAMLVSTFWPQAMMLAVAFALREQFTLRVACAAYFAGAVAGLLIGAWYVWRASAGWRTGLSQCDRSGLFQSARSLVPAALSDQAVNWLPAIIVGALCSAGDAASFAVAARVAALVGFFFLAVNAIAGPKIAAFHRTGETSLIEATIRRSTVLMSLGALPVVAVCLVAPSFVLGFFGDHFVGAGALLVILVVGQAGNLLTGPVMSTLIMCGHEKTFRNIQVVSAVACCGGVFLGSAIWGAQGAALAVAASVIGQKLAAVFFVGRLLKIRASPFAAPFRRTRAGPPGLDTR